MSKLLVFCLDALCTCDIEYMKTLPNFKKIIEGGSYIKHVEPVYPSLTYPCHCSILTGRTVKGHGIPHNEMVEIENEKAPWYSFHKARYPWEECPCRIRHVPLFSARRSLFSEHPTMPF